MISIADFDDPKHRVESASAAFQKGLYHLFVLKNQPPADIYDRVLRIYQCLFQLALAQFLLDFDQHLSNLRVSERLRKHCRNPKQPTRKDLDPAAIVTHTALERWGGFRDGHLLNESSGRTLKLYKRVVESRHNLLYRPFMLDGCFWEDCELLDLLPHVPDIDEIEQAYQGFIVAVVKWRFVEDQDLYKTNPSGYFIQLLFMVYKDIRAKRPTETLLLTYARMLNPDNLELIQNVKDYRNKLLDMNNFVRVSRITFLKEWRVGEL